MSTPAPLLDVGNLTVCYPSPQGPLPAVRDLSLQLPHGEIFALVGETGCGKSTVAHALTGLLEDRRQIESGYVAFEGRDLCALGEDEWRQLRGGKIGLVFQNAGSAMNPVLTVGSHLVETLRAHQQLSRKAARRLAAQLLREVGIPDPDITLRRYPFELSGGMSQRVGIALGICNRPSLLIADEPTSALDPTLQAQVLNLLAEMRRCNGTALLLITHDLALVSGFADRIAVMYHGRLVESGPAGEVLTHPGHPYTIGLLESVPSLRHQREGRRLEAIVGAAPPAGRILPGCPFAPRCRLAEPRCTDALPGTLALSESHWAACIKPGRAN